MTGALLRFLSIPALVSMGFSPAQAPELRITSPPADEVLTGNTRLEAVVSPESAVSTVERVTFYVDGRSICTAERPPFVCLWDPGVVLRGHHIRVVAARTDGPRLIANLRTKDLGYTDNVRTEAVLVPVMVTDGGEFVRG